MKKSNKTVVFSKFERVVMGLGLAMGSSYILVAAAGLTWIAWKPY